MTLLTIMPSNVSASWDLKIALLHELALADAAKLKCVANNDQLQC